MKYNRIVNFPFGKWQVQQGVVKHYSILAKIFGNGDTIEWFTLGENGLPCFKNAAPILFDTPQEAELFIKWCHSEKDWTRETSYAPVLSTPVTVVMGGEEIEGTANFKVTRTDIAPENDEGDVVEVSAVAETDETPVLDIEPTAKARACGNCGEAGHNRRGCPHPAAPRTAKYKTKDIGQTPGLVTKDKEPEADWYFNDILDMLRDGMTEQEVYEKVYMSITNAQFREAMEWAKEHLD